MNRISLKYRIAIIIFVLEAVMVTLVLWQTQKVSLEATHRQREAHEQVMLNMLVNLSRFTLITTEYGEFQPYVEQIQHDPHVLQVLLADYRNRVVVSTEPSLLGLEMTPLHDRQETSWHTRKLSNPAGYLGLLAIEFSNAPLLKAHRDARNLGTIIAAISMTVIAIVGILIGYLLTRRLENLTEATRRIAAGDMKISVEMSGSDEIAILGQNFNSMIEKINNNLEVLRLYNFAIDKSGDSVFLIKPDGRFEWVNESACTALGYSRNELLDMGMPEIDQDYQQERWKAHWQALKKKGTTRFETRYRHKDGTIFPVEITANYFRYGEREFNFAFARDITESKKAEKALKNAYDALETKVSQRTRELANANIKLMELDRMKSMFIASMSHELRTPLNSIIGFSGMIVDNMEENITPEIKDYLERVNRAGHHLLALINDVIDISKLESGNIEVIRGLFNLDEVVSETISNVQQMIAEKGLTIEVNIPSDLWIHTDRQRLFQCILNLIGNAIKFTEQGTISLAAQDLDDKVEISVTDTGIGIAQKDFPRLFDAFDRLESKLKIKAGGTGLGLYLTKKLVTEVLQGTVEVESEEGKGTTFRLRLPKDIESLMHPSNK